MFLLCPVLPLLRSLRTTLTSRLSASDHPGWDVNAEDVNSRVVFSGPTFFEYSFPQNLDGFTQGHKTFEGVPAGCGAATAVDTAVVENNADLDVERLRPHRMQHQCRGEQTVAVGSVGLSK